MSTSAAKHTHSTFDSHQFLIEALDERWKNYRAELKRCREEFSHEAVHDLRAAAHACLRSALAPRLAAPAEIEPSL